LSPKENRDIPPLKPEWVRRLKTDFPQLEFVINGGITTTQQMADHLMELDGVMVGREAYHRPWFLIEWDALMGYTSAPLDMDEVEAQMVRYMNLQATQGVGWFAVSRHMLGLRHGQPGARRWRQIWSDHRLKDRPANEVAQLAREALA
jgi:tRNA-dihydrouridine synthase A